MKLYTGWHCSGPEIRYYPPSVARGRPEGFWDVTGRRVVAEFQGATYWFGSTAGLIMAYIGYNDQRGEPLYVRYSAISFAGRQTSTKAGGVGVWKDEWKPDVRLQQSSEYRDGYVDFWIETFSSSFRDYCKTYAQITQIRRPRYVDPPKLPLIAAAAYRPPKMYATVTGSY